MLRWFLPLGATFRFGVCRSASCPSGSRLPLFGTHRFGVADRRVGLRAHGFRFSARTASGIALGGLVLPPSASEIALGGLVFGLTASAFRHALIRSGCWASSFFRLPLRKLPSAGWPSGSLLSLFGTHRFGDSARRIGSSAFRFGDCRSAGWRFRLPFRSCRSVVGLRIHRFRFSARTVSEWPLGGLAFGFTASAFRHAPIRRLPSAGWFFRWAGWPSGSRLPLFGTHRSAPPCRRREGRRSAPTRHLFHFKTLIPTC